MNEENRYPIDNEQPAEQPEQQPKPPVPPQFSGWGQTPPPPPPKKKKNGALVLVCVLCAAIVVLLMVLTAVAASSVDWSGVLNQSGTTTTTQKPQGNVPVLGITELEDGADGLTTREIVSRNLDSTVLIKTYSKSASLGNGFPFGQSSTEKETHAGSASGIVMTADGYIITNWHCVIDEDTGEPFSRIDVTMYDETVYEGATVVGADESTDLAVIKIDAKGLTPAQFGDSTQMQLGDRVVALGNAGGLGFSATQGILSGLARDVYEDTGYAIRCFQVDAAINPGNSGGPLFNAAGQVIAVNSAKIVAEGYEGLGFAIPINEAKAIVDSLIADGYVRGRVSLGITGQSYADAYYNGFLIYTVNEDSPLRATTVQKGDLIVGVNDVEVTDYASLRAALAKNKVGDTVTLKLLRAGNRRVQEFSVQVKLTEAKQ